MLIMLAIISDSERETLNNLIVCVSNGDKQALGEVYRIASGRMLSVAMGIMRNKQLAEDVLHDSFLRIVYYSNQYQKDTNAYAWLCTIVRNTALNKLKSEGLRASENIDSFFDLSSDVLPSEWDSAIAVRDGLKSLTDKQRTVIWLKYYNDMTVREIAAELNIPRSTTQDLIDKAEKRLKQFLK